MLTDLSREGFRIYPLDQTVFFGKIGMKDVVSFKFRKLKIVAFQKLNIVAVKDAKSKKFLQDSLQG